ncbi:S8 family serine peptidase [Massilia sp. B-10]|nr:S8 family serine peptidase [Massilia sp. B-10]
MSLGGARATRPNKRPSTHWPPRASSASRPPKQRWQFDDLVSGLSYASVMMVAALDENKAWASFSQYNRKVEIAGPGVSVLSTVPMNSGTAPALTVGGTVYAPGSMDGSPLKTATAALADFGLGDKINTAVSGKVCLIARGTIDFAVKVSNCQNSGGVGAVVYNNVAGGFAGTLGTTVTTIPSLTASDTEGAALKNQLGQSATVKVGASSYAYFDGTSMATPHVSAVAALVWSYYPLCTGAQIRASLTKSALDLGPAGRDNKFGYGLVQAKAAKDRIGSLGCGN